MRPLPHQLACPFARSPVPSRTLSREPGPPYLDRMPFMRPPLSKSKKVRRGFFFYLIVIGLPVVVAGLGTGYLTASLIRAKRARLEQAAQEVAILRVRYAELLSRHPGLPLAEDRAPLDAFLALPLARQAKQMAEGQSSLGALRDRCASLVGGQSSAGAAGAQRYKTFTPNGFRDFYNSLGQPNTSAKVLGYPMTGLAAADARITEMAKARGYLPRAMADENVLVSELHYRAQPEILDAFHALRDALRPLGYELAVVSAYRNLEQQRYNVTSRIAELASERRHRAIAPEEIARGEADDIVEILLSKNAIPGYTRHHTGYTMDFTDLASGLVFTDFAMMKIHEVLTADNFLIAKRYGFIPSYPEGAEAQGADPEAWEYVWVGEGILREEW